MKYNLFLFDLDDTLLDFTASERLSFFHAMESLGVIHGLEAIFSTYQIENRALWKQFEEGKVTKDFLKVERFRKTFALAGIDMDAELAANRYLDTLPHTVVLIEHAKEVLEFLHRHGEIGILTNGIHHVQTQRIQNSGLAPYISFVSVSEECGYAKPDVRFFDYSVKKARSFTKEKSILIGDRMEADMLGARNFGIDSCWFNPTKLTHEGLRPDYEIQHLSQLENLFI